MITPLVFTKQGRVLYTGYLSFNSKLRFFLKHTSSGWNWVKAVFYTCLCAHCLVEEDGRTCAPQSLVSGERFILSGPTDILCYRTSCASLKVGLKDRICCAHPRGFVSHNGMENFKSLSSPHQPGLLGNPFFDAVTPGHSCSSASFLSWHIACQQWGGWHLTPALS